MKHTLSLPPLSPALAHMLSVLDLINIHPFVEALDSEKSITITYEREYDSMHEIQRVLNYSKLHTSIPTLELEEKIILYKDDFSHRVVVNLQGEETCVIDELDFPLADFEMGKTYNTLAVFTEAITLINSEPAPATQPENTESQNNLITQRSLPELQPTPGMDAKLDEIVDGIRYLRGVVAEHPLTMQSIQRYLEQLYINSVKEGKLRIVEYNQEQIPYVLVSNEQIFREMGNGLYNLYFVAQDVATEVWQQQIVAVHERFCHQLGHKKAREEEEKMASYLHKELEHQSWRQVIQQRIFEGEFIEE